MLRPLVSRSKIRIVSWVRRRRERATKKGMKTEGGTRRGVRERNGGEDDDMRLKESSGQSYSILLWGVKEETSWRRRRMNWRRLSDY